MPSSDQTILTIPYAFIHNKYVATVSAPDESRRIHLIRPDEQVVSTKQDIQIYHSKKPGPAKAGPGYCLVGEIPACCYMIFGSRML